MFKLVLNKSSQNVYFINNICKHSFRVRYLFLKLCKHSKLFIQNLAGGVEKVKKDINSYSKDTSNSKINNTVNAVNGNVNSTEGNEETNKNLEVTRHNWEPSPSLESGKLLSNYKKLSKFRLTCKYINYSSNWYQGNS